MKDKIATQVKNVSDQFRGHAAVFNMVPPMKDYNGNEWDHVVVSTATLPVTGVETYIFPSDSEGNVQNWIELEGSARGCDCHVEALLNAGYLLNVEIKRLTDRSGKGG